MKNTFDAIRYFHDMTRKNKLARQHSFFPCTCSGLGSLEDVLTNLQRERAFVCVEDTNDSAVTQIGGGWFTRRVFTVFIMHRYDFGNMVDRETKLQLCRDIFHQFHSRMIHDKTFFIPGYGDGIQSLGVENVASREFGQYVLSGLTGLYFMVDCPEPLNLCYDGSEWEE